MVCCGSTGTPFVQTRFLGASIIEFSANIGWNGSGGGLQVTVAEDDCANNGKVYIDANGYINITTEADSFRPPTVGSPVYFYYGGFSYGGILQTWSMRDSATGEKTFDIQITSVAEIMQGVGLILSSYNGAVFGTPNLINVYGWLQHFYGTSCQEVGFNSDYPPYGFGASPTYYPASGWYDIGDGGIGWNSIRAALTYMLNSNVGDFGRRIEFRGASYFVDLSELPYFLDDVRYSGEYMSLDDIISQVCETAGVEYFYDLIPMPSSGGCGGTSGQIGRGPHIIKVRVGNRPKQIYDYSAELVDKAICSNIDGRLSLGSISSFLQQAECFESHAMGVELRLDYTNSFLTGENRQDIWQINYSGDGQGNDTIWPYWGKYANGNVIVGTGISQGYASPASVAATHSFYVEVAHLGIGLFAPYQITVEELRAASVDKSTWTTFLEGLFPAKWALLQTINEHHIPPDSVLNNVFKETFDKNLENPDKGGMKDADFIDWKKYAFNMSDLNKYRNLDILYNYIRGFADQYYGRKFMVKIPICRGYSQDNPYKYRDSWQPADSGWADGSVLGLAANSPYLEQFRVEDGKIKCFVKYFNTTSPLLMEDIMRSDAIPVSPYEVYVEATVDEIVWVGPNDPRAVITVSGPIKMRNREGCPPEYMLNLALIERKVHNSPSTSLTIAKVEKYLKKAQTAGNAGFAWGLADPFIMPVAAAVPLQSERLVYGPWFASIQSDYDYTGGGEYFNGYTNGKTLYERKTDYAPWNFGSFSLMNKIAVSDAISRLGDKYVVETGSITFPGAPSTSFSSILIAGGPAVTDVKVTIGRETGAVTTSLTFKTYTPSFGKLAQARIQSIRKANDNARKAQFELRKKWMGRNRSRLERRIYKQLLRYDPLMPLAGPKKAPSTQIITAKSVAIDDDGNNVRSVVSHEAPEKVGPSVQGGDDAAWRRSAMMDVNGAQLPYSTMPQAGVESNDDAVYMSHFEGFGSSEDLNSEDYKEHNIDYISHAQTPPVIDEGHLPICVGTLSPFLKDGYSVIPTGSGWSQGHFLGQSEGHNIEYVARDGVYPTSMNVTEANSYSEGHWYRAIALRGPLVLASWGYDTDGRPVPNYSETYPEDAQMQFEADWLRKPHKWKVGPVDLRWDNRRKVWTAPTNFRIVKVELQEALAADTTGKAEEKADALLYEINYEENPEYDPEDPESQEFLDVVKKYDYYGSEIEQTDSQISGSTIKGWPIEVWNTTKTSIAAGERIMALYDTFYKKYFIISSAPSRRYFMLNATLGISGGDVTWLVRDDNGIYIPEEDPDNPGDFLTGTVYRPHSNMWGIRYDVGAAERIGDRWIITENPGQPFYSGKLESNLTYQPVLQAVNVRLYFNPSYDWDAPIVDIDYTQQPIVPVIDFYRFVVDGTYLEDESIVTFYHDASKDMFIIFNAFSCIKEVATV